MLRSVQRLERRGGFRPRLVETRRDYLRFLAVPRISVGDQREYRQDWKSLLQRAVHRPEEVPE